jgi:hypothetical protein
VNVFQQIAIGFLFLYVALTASGCVGSFIFWIIDRARDFSARRRRDARNAIKEL